jgi:hypothetical protein
MLSAKVLLQPVCCSGIVLGVLAVRKSTSAAPMLMTVAAVAKLRQSVGQS